jgi:hypothetical protein
MLKRFLVALTLISCAAGAGCIVEDENDFDFEDERFFYGCKTTPQCADPAGDSTPYVCCLDLLDPNAEICEGRCLPKNQCATGKRVDDDPNLCAALE